MNVAWSPHANALFFNILQQIERALYVEDAYRWREKIVTAVGHLADFPDIGTTIPAACFHAVPPNADRLRQLICKPYRIVYEKIDDEIHILSIRHARMLVTVDDTAWH